VKMKRFGIIGTAHLVLIKDGKVLMLKRANTSYMDGHYSLVAGHVEKGEPVTNAMVREAKEEVGLELEPTALKMLHVLHRNENESRIDFFLTADAWRGEARNLEPHKCSELKWFSLDELPENTVPYIREALGQISQSKFYSELFW